MTAMTSQRVTEKFSVDTPLGPLLVCLSGDKVLSIEPGSLRSPPRSRKAVRLHRLLSLYLSGEPVDLSEIPVDPESISPFSASVLSVLRREVRPGQLISYKDLGALLGSPALARAVGTALRANPCPIVVPCHRVIRSNGEIGGYSLGLEWKRFLLELEGHRIRGDRVEGVELSSGGLRERTLSGGRD